MATPELVLHVGSQQTGASRLRRALGRLRPQLHEHGVGLVGHPTLARLPVEGWRCDGPVDPSAVARFEAGVAAAVDDEVAAIRRAGAEPRTVVISSDHLLGRRNLDHRDERTYRPYAVGSVAQVIGAVGASRARLVLYVRRQDRLMEACHLRALANGATGTLAEQFPRRFEPRLDHLELVERLAIVPEVAEVRVRPFELVAAHVQQHVHDLLEALGLDGRLDLTPVADGVDRPDRLVSARGARIARDVNPLLETERDRTLLRRFLLREFPATDDAATRLLDDEDRARILAAYAPVNRELFRQHLPWLPAGSYDDDAATSALADLAPPVVSTPRDLPQVVRRRVAATTRRVAAAGRNVVVGRREARRQLAAHLEIHRLDGEVDRADRRSEVDDAVDRSRTDSEVADGDRADGRARAVLAAVTGALEAARVAYLVAPAEGDGTVRIVVPSRRRRRAAGALRALVGTVRLVPLGVATDEPRRRPGRWRGQRWGVRHLADDGRADPVLHATIELLPLERTTADQLWRERWRAEGQLVARGPASVEEVDVGPGRYLSVRTLAPTPAVDAVTFPIDVVYTWVDGTDPRWLASKQATLRELDPQAHPVDAADVSRYRSYDELRYSLRSLARYADFVRHVFVVTDRQVPTWLDTTHPRLTVVDHREILPARCLPTFNSHAIESRLHHIDGLAEHYLYLNDDFFLGRPVVPDRFFHANGLAKFFPSPARIPHAGSDDRLRSVDAAARTTQRIVQERFGRRVEHKLKHTPYPQRRSVLFELEELLADGFARTAASRVRGPDDLAVPSSLSHHYAHLTGRAVPGRISSRYVSLGEPGLARHLGTLRRRRDFDVLCVNDTVEAHGRELERRRRLLARFMEASWPTPSPFER